MAVPKVSGRDRHFRVFPTGGRGTIARAQLCGSRFISVLRYKTNYVPGYHSSETVQSYPVEGPATMESHLAVRLRYITCPTPSGSDRRNRVTTGGNMHPSRPWLGQVRKIPHTLPIKSMIFLGKIVTDPYPK
jgi:hypothetical protein